MPRLNTAEKPVQANIKGVGTHLVKINKHKLVRYQPRYKAGVKFTDGESALLTNPELGRTGKCKTK